MLTSTNIHAEPKDAKSTDTAEDLSSNSSKDQNIAEKTKPKSKPGRTSKRSKASEASSNLADIDPSSAENHAELLEVDPNNGRRKRRKTAIVGGKERSKDTKPSTPSSVANLEGPASTNDPASLSARLDTRTNKSVDLSGEAPHGGNDEIDKPVQDKSLLGGQKPVLSEDGKNTLLDKQPDSETFEGNNGCSKSVESKPKKVLKLNPKTGTFGSPPPKPPPVQAKPKKPAVRGKQPKSKLVIFRYGTGHSLPWSVGTRINEILDSMKPVIPVPSKEAPEAPKSIGGPPKPVHPLFLGKLASRIANTRKSPPKDNGMVDLISTSSPSKLKPGLRQWPPSVKSSAPLFSGFGGAVKLLKFPGAVEPAWPWKGMLHVRGNVDDIFSTTQQQPARTKTKKSKDNAIRIPRTEDVIEALALDLRISEVVKTIQHIDLDEFPSIPSSLRTVIKHNESGLSIQSRVLKQLFSRPQFHLPDNSPDEDEKNRAPLHPAVAKMYASIATSLSAFDKGQCETQVWAQKYSPQYATEVLQSGDEAVMLKTWLQTLTVNAVEAASGIAPSLPKKLVKRKRKAKKLDGFIVSSDEDDFIQNGVSENDSESTPTKNKKTFIKSGVSKSTGKPNNAMLMSGPHGCGKTAAVYAVAKELGFEVFEINPSSRRCGKDITDKVGDMTRNHIVHHSTAQASAEPVDAEEKRIDDALADDLKTGRQGTMNSFFQLQPAEPKLKPKPKAISIETKLADTKLPDTSRQPPREQKQSLILIEEADVLYKEDSNFWPTIINLIQTSRRPIVITCNDESVIDTSALALHGVLRFTSPPTDLAVDYLLSIAACEGHVLKRSAVQSLYETRGLDLRASIMELNYWCQFGVGSLRGGLDWFYSRFPRGSDIDKDGKIIRVVSEGTYQAGMGCLSQDFLESHIHHLDIEEEMLREVWDEWQVDSGEWQTSLNMVDWADKHQLAEKTCSGAALSMYEEFAESLSDADLCSSRALATDAGILLDTNTLKPTQKALDDYVLPHRTLTTAEPLDSKSCAKDISFWLRSRARAYLQVNEHIKHDLEVPTELDRLSEASLIQLIRTKVTTDDETISRENIDSAFEPITNPEKAYVWSNAAPLISIFSGNLGPIVEDAAPYVRSIVAYDARLAQERVHMSNLLSEGGTRGKRMRTTRAAMSALEGGARKTTRREKYFNASLNPYLVMRTGMESWMDAAVQQTAAEAEAQSATESRRSSKGSIRSEIIDGLRDEKDELAESSI